MRANNAVPHDFVRAIASSSEPFTTRASLAEMPGDSFRTDLLHQVETLIFKQFDELGTKLCIQVRSELRRKSYVEEISETDDIRRAKDESIRHTNKRQGPGIFLSPPGLAHRNVSEDSRAGSVRGGAPTGLPGLVDSGTPENSGASPPPAIHSLKTSEDSKWVPQNVLTAFGTPKGSVVPAPDSQDEVEEFAPCSKLRRITAFSRQSSTFSSFLRGLGPTTPTVLGGGIRPAEFKELQNADSVKFELTIRGCNHATRKLVQSQTFDYAVCSLIILNAASIGIQTDYSARNPNAEAPGALRAVELTFCVIFALELLLRLCVFNRKFFIMKGYGWNIFDSLVVGLQVFEESLAIAVEESDSMVPQNLSFARLLRILRLVRVIRLVRILRLIRELRMLVASISNSMKSLGWTLLLLLLMIYIVALYLTQTVTDHRVEADLVDADAVPVGSHNYMLIKYYGSLGRTMLSLFEAISGGVDWDDLVHPLMTEINPWLGVLFSLYIAFTCLAMMNVVTGVFVDSVLISAEKDKNYFLLTNVKELLTSMNCEKSGSLSWNDFNSKLGTRQMQNFFKGIDVDMSEAKGLFTLLDIDGSGYVDADEFLSGCIRLRGPAKALHTALLSQDVRVLRTLMESLCISKKTSIRCR